MTLHDLCRAVGLPYSPTTRTLGPSAWDGRRLHGHRTDGWHFRGYELWHEVAHWLLCPPELRRWPGFGLGAPLRSPSRLVWWGPVVMHDVGEPLAVVLQRRIGDAGGFGENANVTLEGPAVDRARELLVRAGCHELSRLL